MAFFQLGSASLPAWMALKNSRKVSDTTKTNGAGTYYRIDKNKIILYLDASDGRQSIIDLINK